MPCANRLLTLLVFCLLVLTTTARARQPNLSANDTSTPTTASEHSRFENDFKLIAGFGPRLPGSSGYDKTARWLADSLAALPGVELQQHQYNVMVPKTGRATLDVAGRSVNVSPFWPAHTRLAATPVGGLSGKLVYVGNCEYDQLKPASLRGNIAVVEVGAGARWSRAFYFGAKAVVVLPDASATNAEFATFDVRAPADLPRFYLDDADLAARLREGTDLGPARLEVVADWTRVTATNFYALLTPRGGAKPVKGRPTAAVTFVVPFDNAGFIYDVAPGASQALNVSAALQLARRFAAEMDQADPAVTRPVMFVFTGADSIAQLGMRQTLLALAETPALYDTELADIDTTLASLRSQQQRLEALKGQPWHLNPTTDRELIKRLTTLVETDLSIQQDKLFRLRVLPDSQLTDTQREQMALFDANRIPLSGVRSSLQTDPRTLEQPARKTLATYYATLALERIVGTAELPGLIAQYEARKAELARRVELYTWLANKVQRPARPDERDTSTRLMDVIVGIDLSDGGARLGPMFQGGFLRYSTKGQIQNYSDYFLRTRNDADKGVPEAQWFKALTDVVDFEPLNSAKTPTTFTGNLALSSELSTSWGVPGFSMVTLDDFRLRRDTPGDTADRVDFSRVLPQFDALTTLLTHAAGDVRFMSDSELRRNRNGFIGQVVGTAPGKPVPDLPLNGYVVSYQFVSNTMRTPALHWAVNYAVGVRRTEVRDTDVEGRYRFEGFSRYPGQMQSAFVQSFYFERGSGATKAISDLGRSSSDISPFANLTTSLNPMRSLPFECDEVTLVGLYDPRFVQSLGEVQIIDARRNTDAPRFSATLHDRTLAAFVDPSSKNYLLFRYGQIGNRLVLLNMPDDIKTADERAAKLGQGFTVDELQNLGPLSVETAHDFIQLDAKRLSDYRAAGVSSALIDDLHSDAKSQLDAARKALDADDALAGVKNANGAWATEALVYAASNALASDVVRAAIFLLLLAVPFSVCMERLLIAHPNIYAQIAGICTIFLVMTGALWLFHPAFKISTSPLIIILSFAIIFMSLIVIGVIYQKFDVELKKIRSGRGNSEGANFLRASVLTNAVMLGIANMRKRKIRTTLTATTIVLITFAVLVFASAASFRSTRSLPVGISSDHPGLMLRQRGYRPMPIDIVSELKTVFPNQQIVQRWWNANAGDPNELNLIIAGGSDGQPVRTAGLPALMGLSPGESKLSRIGEVIGTEKFDRLESGATDIIYFSKETAEQLQVKEGDTVRSGGIALEVAGIYDAADFDRKVFNLAGEPLAPLKYESNALDAGGRRLSDNAAESITFDADGGSAELSSVYQHLPSTQFAIVPATVSQRLINARLASVAIRFPDEQVVVSRDGKLIGPYRATVDTDADLATKEQLRTSRVKWASDEVAKRYTIVTYAGLEDGVQMVSASTPTKITGSQVAIPLVIGGLIIFNTMMGSIAERKREIHIYTSLGLAPLHVGALFIAEALTYGVIGTVFGYIIGQGVGTALLHLGWLGNMTLDYSGTSALLTIGLILLVVLLSALVPARLASKIAAPSIERSWRVPVPVNGQIMATLPFTINKTAAEGVVAYLAEFFESHREGSIGKFATDEVTAFAWTGEEPESNGKPSRGVQTTVWLTPFDLGVRQHLMLLIHPGEFPEIYEVQVLLSRLSGDDGSWYRMNRSFLTELRKQFLQWRSLSPARMREYVENSKALFNHGGTETRS
jgi:ABC-type lipoprotein release transport system permease subunit